jgi:hypothetical protein
MTFSISPALALVCLGLIAPGLAAQPSVAPPPNLIELVPDDFGLCLRVRDLRGQHERLVKSAWYQAFSTSALGHALFEAPELRPLLRAQRMLKAALGVDWATLRDGILGSEVVLAYRPGAPGKADDERGVILLWAPEPKLLGRLVDQLNEVQRKSGALRALESQTYLGKVYQRRNERDKDHFYYLDGALLAVAGKEETIRAIIEKYQRAQPAASPWTARFRRAGADTAFATLCVNPRVLELSPARLLKAGRGLPSFWQALEALFITVHPGAALEVRLSVQADPAQLPLWLRHAFLETSPPSTLWQHFPAQAIATIAARTNFAEALATALEMTPPDKRAPLVEGAQRSLGAITGLDFFTDILPNVGPDWGVCLLPAADPQQLPQLVAALAVRPGTQAVAVDQALFKAVSLVAGLVVLDYNKNHPDALRLETVLQEKVEVRYLQGAKFFPPGVQPAFALKEGFLLFATSPQALEKFRPAATKLAPGEAPLVRLSAPGLANLLRQRRAQIVAKLSQNQHVPPAAAQQSLTNFAEFLELFDRASLSHHAEAGQATWLLRISPASE